MINYSKKNTQYENEILLMKAIDIQDKIENPVSTENKKMSREEFSLWLRNVNKLGK